ncbi:hypothetical protein ACFL2A_03605 [Thermodesulfobacteriota bacterium]
MKVKTKNNYLEMLEEGCNYNFISPEKVYTVLAIYDDGYEIMNDLLEPIAYQKEFFEVVDSTIPENWVKYDRSCDNEDSDGTSYYVICHPDLSNDLIHEHFFGGELYAVDIHYKYYITNGVITKEEWDERVKLILESKDVVPYWLEAWLDAGGHEGFMKRNKRQTINENYNM